MEPQTPPTPQPETQPSLPSPSAGGSTTKALTKVAVRSTFAVINAIGGLTLALTALYVISASLFPNSADIAGIVLIPMAALVIGAVAIYDVVVLSAYIARHRHDGASKSRDWAIVGVCIALALLAAIGLVAYSDISGLGYDKKLQHNQGISQDQTLMTQASAAGYGFDLLLPEKVPAGFTLSMAQVADDANNPDSVALTEQYQTASDAGFSLIEYSAAKRPSYMPPANCGYYLGPSDNPTINARVYPCTLVGQTILGAKVYYYEIQDNDTTYDSYYVTTGRDVVLMSVIKGAGAPNKAQAISVLSELGPVSLGQLIKINTNGS